MPTSDSRGQSNMQQVSEDVREIKKDVKDLAQTVNCLNLDYQKGHTAVTKDIESVTRENVENRRLIDSLKDEVETLKKSIITVNAAIGELMKSYSALKWFVSIAGAAVIVGALGLLWAIITHQIMLVQP